MAREAAIGVQDLSAPGAAPLGLTSAEARRRLGEFGANAAVEPAPPRWRAFLAKFWSPVPWMLEAALVLQLGLGEYVEATVIAALLLFNATLGYLQEGRASDALAALKQRLAPTALVRRDGEWVRLPASELVPGDAIRLPLGALVPADAAIISGSLLVDQSMLTGESVPVDANPGSRVFASSLVRRGQAIAEVTATGAKTYFGRAVELVRVAQSASTEQAAIFGATRNLAIVNGTVAVLIIGYAYTIGLPSPDLIRLALTALLATIPVALPATFTLSAAFGAQTLARHGVLLTRLSAAHEAGAMDVLCADKTGTLTRNALEVVDVVAMPAFGVILRRQGKWYPGESLPRWALDVVGLRDGTRLWAGGGERRVASPEAAEKLARAIAGRLGVRPDAALPAFEDPWQYVRDEADLPPGVDPLKADLTDAEERRRLARVLDHGLATPVAWALPLSRVDGAWRTDTWEFRRENLFLIPGDSPAGLRLPLKSLGGPLPAVAPPEPFYVPDPRLEEVAEARRLEEKARAKAARPQRAADLREPGPRLPSVRTALCVEARGEDLFVFLPPVPTGADFVELVRAVDAAARDTGLDVRLEGYPPAWSPEVIRFSVTPDPGVLEVNVQPTSGGRECAEQIDQVFDAALHVGLHSEKYMLDGRQEGSGGGNHITLGGPRALESPFVVRPDLLASLVTFVQHHPAISYLFTGLFVGPTSQAPRVDEARHDALYELEIALRRLADRSQPAPPWQGDWLLRNLLVDVAGNGHRAEISIDKLFDWRSPHGRQGLVELRAFEMPPHPRMAAAQAILARALVAAFAREPYAHGLVRWGTELHDRFLLPFWLWRDMEDVLAFLEERGIGLPRDAYRPFVEFRCPVVGRLQVGGVAVEVRNALEPWPVMGEEPGAGGTSRFVDSSMERVEVRAEGLEPERFDVLVNGLAVPLRATGTAGEHVGGVRFRAWAPESSLQPHLGIHHPLRFDLWDRWARRSVGACAYHVWHPEGRGYEAAPLTRFEATARRAARFTEEGPLPWPTRPRATTPHPEYPHTLDLRLYGGDRPMPVPEEEEGEGR